MPSTSRSSLLFRRTPLSTPSSPVLARTPSSSCTYSTPTASSDVLDFLYPSFGFFSRSLPKSSSHLTQPASALRRAVPPSHWPIIPRTSSLERVESLRGSTSALWGADTLCFCRRAPQSCLRCRAASTSSRAARKEEQQEDESPWNHRNREHGKIREKGSPPPPPPPPLTEDLHDVPRYQRTDIQLMTNFLNELGDKLPYPYPVKRTSSLNRIIERSRWPISKSVAAFGELTKRCRQIDVLRSLSMRNKVLLLSYLVRVARSPIPIEEDVETLLDNPAALSTSRHQRRHLRIRAGHEILRLIDELNLFDETRRFDVATVYVEALSLIDRLPPVPLPPFDPDNLFTSPLLTIFQYREPLTALQQCKILYAKLQTLSALCDGWARSVNGPEEALHFICQWGLIDLVIRRKSEGEIAYRGPPLPNHLPQALGTLFSRLPLDWLESPAASNVDRQHYGEVMVEVFRVGGFVERAVEVYSRLEFGENFLSRLSILSSLVKALRRRQLFTHAERLAQELERHALALEETSTPEQSTQGVLRQAWEAIVELRTTLGDEAASSVASSRLSQLGGVTSAGSEVYAIRSLRNQPSKAAELVERFERGKLVADPALPSQQIRLSAAMIHACVLRDDVEGAMEEFHRVVDAGLRPPLDMINTLLSGYSMRTDSEKAYELFNMIPSFEQQPNAISYGCILALHARRREPEAVLSVSRKMIESGVVPRLNEWTTVMSAYVEVEEWPYVIQIYDFLLRHPDPQMKPDVVASNIVLRAAVLSKCSINTILGFFRQIMDDGLTPSAYTCSLVLQALCLDGQMGAAESFVRGMQNPSTSSIFKGMLPMKLDSHILGLLVFGHIANGNMEQARHHLAFLRESGVEETSIIHSLVISSFLKRSPNLGIETAIQLAENFLDLRTRPYQPRSVTPRSDTALVRGNAPSVLYSPIIRVFCKQLRLSDAIRLFERVNGAQQQLPISLYTMLMAGYRNERHFDNVRSLWLHVRHLVLDLYPAPVEEEGDDTIIKINPLHRHTLCFPLSIYLDALTDAGEYRSIVDVWRRLAREGFAFDPSNWNRLGVAACKLGTIEEALWITEHVLLRPADEAPSDATALFDLGSKPGNTPHARRVSRSLPRDNRFTLERESDRDIDNLWAESLEAESFNPLDWRRLLGATDRQHFLQWWRPHSGLYSALNRVWVEEGLDEEKKEALKRDYPRAMEGLQSWRTKEQSRRHRKLL
ncbi:hypothetical protein T439DRAFT_323653 [Meredithblackwellia eburnea MCA 4105]